MLCDENILWKFSTVLESFRCAEKVAGRFGLLQKFSASAGVFEPGKEVFCKKVTKASLL